MPTEMKGNRGLIRLPWRLIMGSAVILLAASVAALSPLLAEGPYTVPAVSSVTTTVPLFPQIDTVCLVRSEPSGSQVPQRLMCYAAVEVTPPQPLPPPPFNSVTHQLQVADFDAATGELSLSLLPCTEFLPGFYAASSNQVIQLDKAGGPASGTVSVSRVRFAMAGTPSGEVGNGQTTRRWTGGACSGSLNLYRPPAWWFYASRSEFIDTKRRPSLNRTPASPRVSRLPPATP